MYLNNKRIDKRRTEKKDGVGWIVDLKISKKLKGKWEKKDGFCRVVYLKVVDLKLTKNIKEKQKKKMWVGQSCVFEWQEIYYKNERKKRWGWLKCGFEIK